MLRPRLTEVRETFTRGGPWVWIETLLLGFFAWSSLNYWVGQLCDKILHIFRSRPQTFCWRPNAAEYCNSEKPVKHRWLLYTCARFGELWPTNPWDPRIILLFLKLMTLVNSLGHVLFSFARWQHDYIRANAATLRDLHDTCLGSGYIPSPVGRADCMCLHGLVHASGSRSLQRAAALSSTYCWCLQLVKSVNDRHQIFHIFGSHSQTFCSPARTP